MVNSTAFSYFSFRAKKLNGRLELGSTFKLLCSVCDRQKQKITASNPMGKNRINFYGVKNLSLRMLNVTY